MVVVTPSNTLNDNTVISEFIDYDKKIERNISYLAIESFQIIANL